MPDLAVIAITFGLVAVGELPDKTGIACLLLGTRYPWRWAFVGVAAAFTIHAVIAVVAGSALSLLPHRAVDVVVAVLFGIGAVQLWREGRTTDEEAALEAEEQELDTRLSSDAGFLKVASVGFSIILVAEWGDITQILTANLAAKYHDPFSVGIGAVLALWSVALLAMLAGRTLSHVLPVRLITRIAAVVMVGLCVFSAVEAIIA